LPTVILDVEFQGRQPRLWHRKYTSVTDLENESRTLPAIQFTLI